MSTGSRGALPAKNAHAGASGNAVDATGHRTIERVNDRSTGLRAHVQAQALGNEPVGTGPRPVEAAPLGALLADVRTARGLSARALAAAIGAAPSTVTRIERSQRRVSPAMLRSLAAALSPDDPEPLLVSLTEAAGLLLVPDSPGGVRRRERRMQRATTRARRERNRQEVAEFRRREAMQREAASMTASAYRLLDDPNADLDRVEALMDGAEQLRSAAGPPIGTIFEQQIIATTKVLGRAATRATGKTPQRRRPTRRRLPAPARDGSASEREVLAYIRQQSREELGVEYDD